MERIDLRLVEYFVAVAEELHFGRAAERLHIAQPSLSQQIRRLEAQLGVTVLKRDSRHVELTDAGATLLREGRKTLSQAQHTIRATRSAGAPSLTVGFYGSAANALLPNALRAFNDRHPSLEVAIRELPLGSLNPLLSGDISVAFTRLAPGQSELEIEVLAHEPRLVALPAAHRLARRASLTFGELREERFITNPAEASDGARPTRWLTEQRRHGLRGVAASRTTGVAEILTLVAAGRGVSLVPRVVARHQPRPDVAYVPVEDAEPAVVSLAWRPGGFTPVVKEFVEIVRRLAAEKRD